MGNFLGLLWLLIFSDLCFGKTYALLKVGSEADERITQPKSNSNRNELIYVDQNQSSKKIKCSQIKSLEQVDSGLDMMAKYGMSSVLGGIVGLALGGPFTAAALTASGITYLMSEKNIRDSYCQQ